MDHFEVKRALDSMMILVDTREQDTPRLRKRLRAMDCPYERRTLNFGEDVYKRQIIESTTVSTCEIAQAL